MDNYTSIQISSQALLRLLRNDRLKAEELRINSQKCKQLVKKAITENIELEH